MANQNVRFFFTDDKRKYDVLLQKDPLALYFIEDAETGYRALYKGENLIAVGSNASSIAAGLMSPADKQALDRLVANPGGVEFVPVDGTISIVDGEDGKKNIGVAVSSNEGNALKVTKDGLFVSTVSADDLIKLGIATKDDVKTIVSETVGVPNAEQFNIDENGVLTLKDIDADKIIYNGEKLSDVIYRMTSSYTWGELPEVVNTEATNAASVIASANSGAVVKMSAGTVAQPIAVEKSVTVEGENAGIAQNHQQEV